MNQTKIHCQFICHVKKAYLPIQWGQKYSYILGFVILLALKSRITDIGEWNDLLLLFYKGAIFSQLSDYYYYCYYCFAILSSSVVFILVLFADSAASRSLETQHWLTTAHFQKCRADLTSHYQALLASFAIVPRAPNTMGITATFVALYQAYLICYMMMMMMITIVIIILSLNRDFLGQKIV